MHRLSWLHFNWKVTLWMRPGNGWKNCSCEHWLAWGENTWSICSAARTRRGTRDRLSCTYKKLYRLHSSTRVYHVISFELEAFFVRFTVQHHVVQCITVYYSSLYCSLCTLVITETGGSGLLSSGITSWLISVKTHTLILFMNINVSLLETFTTLWMDLHVH